MMSFLVFLILTLFALNCDSATLSQKSEDPDVPGLCFHNEEYYPPGEHKVGCSRLFCSPNGWASIHSCFETTPHEGCFRGNEIDPDLPFPQCCKREYTCQNEDKTVYTITDF